MAADRKYISEGSYRDWTGFNVAVPGYPKKLFQVSVHGSWRNASQAATRYRNSLTREVKVLHNGTVIHTTRVPKGDRVSVTANGRWRRI
jgi:hypothetical protein